MTDSSFFVCCVVITETETASKKTHRKIINPHNGTDCTAKAAKLFIRDFCRRVVHMSIFMYGHRTLKVTSLWLQKLVGPMKSLLFSLSCRYSPASKHLALALIQDSLVPIPAHIQNCFRVRSFTNRIFQNVQQKNSRYFARLHQLGWNEQFAYCAENASLCVVFMHLSVKDSLKKHIRLAEE